MLQDPNSTTKTSKLWGLDNKEQMVYDRNVSKAKISLASIFKCNLERASIVINEQNETPFTQLEEITIVELQAAMANGELTTRELAEMYLERIRALDQQGPTLQSILEINSAALK